MNQFFMGAHFFKVNKMNSLGELSRTIWRTGLEVSSGHSYFFQISSHSWSNEKIGFFFFSRAKIFPLLPLLESDILTTAHAVAFTELKVD